MSIWEAIVLGVIQGLSEFLPISSSGHLELANYLFGISESGSLQFAIAVHGATVLSIIVVFFREIIGILAGVFKFRLNDQTILALNIIVSLVPILFVGLMFKDQIEALFTGNILVVGIMLLFTSVLLTFSHFTSSGSRPITPKRAFIIGIAQAVAVMPGLSRSGATISAGLIQGIDRKNAAKFSFLMILIPVIGMNLLELLNASSKGDSVGAPALIAGFLSAFLVGTFACRWMIRLVERGKLIWFAIYCAIVGIVAIALYLI